jgi:hypothetical protein
MVLTMLDISQRHRPKPLSRNESCKVRELVVVMGKSQEIVDAEECQNKWTIPHFQRHLMLTSLAVLMQESCFWGSRLISSPLQQRSVCRSDLQLRLRRTSFDKVGLGPENLHEPPLVSHRLHVFAHACFHFKSASWVHMAARTVPEED